MQFLGKIFISISSFFKSCKTSNMDVFFVAPNFRNKRFLFKGFSVNNTFAPKFIPNLSVCLILPVICLAQIINSVIASIAIYMINLIRRPFSCTIKPSQTMGSIKFLVNFKVNVPFMMKISSLLPNSHFLPWRVPKKQASVFFISKDAKEFVMFNFFHVSNLTHFAGFAKENF